MVYILVAILMFGVLIAVHEFGHFITAKLFGIRVNEFSIGMGPALFKREKGETLYSLRLLPIGGYCAMEGEDEESDDPRAFGNAAAWKKVIVLVAGAFMNFLTGLIIVLVLYAPAQGFYQEIYAESMEGYGTEDCGLQEGDRFLSVDGHKVLTYGNAQFYMGRAGDTMDLVVERDGEKVYLDDVSLPRQERTDEEGNTTNYRGITIGAQVLPAGLGTKLIYSWNTTLDYVRLVWVSLGDLVRGAVGIKDLSGPVGIVTAIGQAASYGWQDLLELLALITINLGVFNLLPFPALDGGKVVFLIIEGVTGHAVPEKLQGTLTIAAFALLFGLMLFATYNDIIRLVTGAM